MFDENFFERVANLSIALVDLDEKEYTELAALLSLLDPLKEEVKSFKDGTLITSLSAVCESIEKLILSDIDPISDPNTIFDSIYLNFEIFNKAVNATRNKGLLQIDTEDNGLRTMSEETLDLNDEEIEVKHDQSIQIENPATTQIQHQDKESLNEVKEAQKPVTANVVIETEDTDDTDDELFMDFINEANEYVVTLESLMLDLEQSPKDLGLINEIFRPFHTLKGVSGFLGLKKINHISHEAENILDKARNGKLEILPETSALIFKTIDLIKRILSNLNIKNKVEQATEQEVESIVSLLSSTASGIDISGELSINKTTQKASSIDQNNLSETLKKTTNDQPVTPDPITPKETNDGGDGGGDTSRSTKQQEESVRVKTEKLDFLIDMVGELVISYNLFYQDRNIIKIFDHEFQKKKSQLHRVISDLQKASLALRMIPISQTFSKMKRVIRDYSSQHKKQIDLILHGEETEIDRNMVDSLYEPLMHMIRNSCDHGVESAEDRKAKGKPSKGIITLSAYHKGNTIVIEVKDDGRGLNKEKIYKKALEKGLVRENQQLTDSEIYKLVFLPGFSTMEVVSNVSGRGVGMDVVMQAITMLGGTVDIITEPNKGSTFRIALPLTLAIIEGMLVKVSGELYIIPTANIKRSIKPDDQILSSVMNKAETVLVEGHLIPIIRLNRKFKFIPQSEDLHDGLLIILETNEKVFAIAVDEVLDIQSVVVKTLGEKFQDLDGISGATIMGDGKVGLILDVNKLDVER